MFCIFTITCCPRPSRYTLTASTLLITGRLALRTTGLVAIISIFLIITTVTYAVALRAPVGTQLIARFLTIFPELASQTFSNTFPRYSVTIWHTFTALFVTHVTIGSHLTSISTVSCVITDIPGTIYTACERTISSVMCGIASWKKKPTKINKIKLI